MPTYTENQVGLVTRGCDVFRPPERLNPWQWAEKNLVLPSQVTAFPGLYRTDVTPYVKGPLEAFQTHERLIMCFGTQTSKTTILFALLGYIIDQDPGPTMFVYPTTDVAKRVSKRRIQPVINGSPSLARHKTGIDDDFQLLTYSLDRMPVVLVGSNSPSAVSSDPIRYLVMDEVDKFALETSREADSFSLATERVKSYWNARVLVASTPTGPEGTIWSQFKLSDQRYLHVPCPHCGGYQKLEFEYLRWPSLKHVRIRDLDALGWYECRHCNGKILDKHKPEMLANSKWVADAPGELWAGFHINSLYPLWHKTRFGSVAVQYLRSRNYPDKYRNFVNSWLALPWDPKEEGTDTVTSEVLVKATEKAGYRKNQVPAHGAYLTMGVDVQEHELFWTVWGWAKRDGLLHSFLVSWGRAQTFDEIWQIAQQVYPCTESNLQLQVRVGGIDSRYRTDEVYQFCRKHPMFRPMKGARVTTTETGAAPWKEVPVDKAVKVGGLLYVLVNTSYWKERIYGEANRGEPLAVAGEILGDDTGDKPAPRQEGPRIWHLPTDVDTDIMRHLASERMVRRRNKYGVPERVWVVKEGHEANHFLDCTVYAYCAAGVAGIDFLRETPKPQKPDEITNPSPAVIAAARQKPSPSPEESPWLPKPRTNWFGR